MNSNNILFLMIPGFNGTKRSWGKIVSKLGEVYSYTPIFYTKYKKGLTENDLILRNHCEQLFENIHLKKNQKIILISHSIGSYFAFEFAKKYKKYVILSIMLDPAFMGPVGKERLSDERFVKFEKEIKDNNYSIQSLLKNKNYDILDKYVRHNLIKQVPVKFSKFPTPTIYFRNLEFEDDQGYSMKDRAIREGLYFNKKDKKFKIYWLVNETHYCFKNDKVISQILLEIKNSNNI